MDKNALLVSYFSQYLDLSTEEIELIKKEDIVRDYGKNDFLLKAGEYAQVCFLVLSGCVKRYYIEDGEEKIVEFFTENDPITPVSYVDKAPSKYYLECLEPCIVSTGNEERTQRFLQEFPRFIPIFVKIGDQLSSKKQLFLDDLKNLSPEARYQQLMEARPDLIERVPQYMIASYLGIQPESLSRIRKRMWSQQ